MKELIILILVSVVSFVLGGCMDGCRNKKTWAQTTFFLDGCQNKKTGEAQTTLSNKKVVAIYFSGDVKTFEEAQESLTVVRDEDISPLFDCLSRLNKSTNLCPPGCLIWIRFEDDTLIRLTVHFDPAEKIAFVENHFGDQFESKTLYYVYDAIFEIPEDDEEDYLGVEIPEGGFK